MPDPSLGCRVDPRIAALVNGCVTDDGVGAIGFAKITDGLGSTMFAAEKAISPLRGASGDLYIADPFVMVGWWFFGNLEQTLMTAAYPPNLSLKMKANNGNVGGLEMCALSLHPGGLNVLLGDGTVRFVKETISTTPYNPDGQSRPGPGDIWRALASRNGREIIGADSY